jgi:hypothetical protein
MKKQSNPSAMSRRHILRRSLRIRDQRTRSSQNMTLNRLPAELLTHIASFLQPVSAAALTIATRSTFFKLGTRYLRIINQDIPLRFMRWSYDMKRAAHVSVRLQREMFLRLLERDLPDMSYCFHCERLHGMTVSDEKRECTSALVELPRTQILTPSLHIRGGIVLLG